MGLLERIRRRLQGEPARDDAPGLFTARSPVTTPGGTGPGGAPRTGDLWDEPADDAAPADADAVHADAEVAPPVDPAAELAAIEELAPPPAGTPQADTPTVDLPAVDDVAPEGSTAEEPLFGAHEAAPEPPPPPVPPLFDPPLFDAPAVAAEPEPQDLVIEAHPEVFAEPAGEAAPDDEPGPTAAEAPAEAERTMRVHDERLDKRPGPIRMSPSEAIRLAQDGPRAPRRLDHPER